MTEKQDVTEKLPGIGNRVLPLRFIAFLVVLVLAWLGYRSAMPADDWRQGTAISFDVAAMVFLVSLWPLLSDSSAKSIRQHARENDANRFLVLILTSLVSLVAMAAITGEMADAKDGDLVAILKMVGTLLLIWLFANAVYTLHYAHAFYARGKDRGADAAGIDFPETKEPDYWDFAYFSYTLGMTFQTSDVAITAPAIRKIALLHSFASFIFNIGVIAFAINVLSGA